MIDLPAFWSVSDCIIYRRLWPVWALPRWPKSSWWISNCLRVAVGLSSWSNNRWRCRCCCCCRRRCRPPPGKYYRPHCSYSIHSKRRRRLRQLLACCCCCNSAISSCSMMKRPPATKISWDIAAAPVRPPLMIGFDSPPSLQKLFPMAPADLFMFLDKAEKKRKRRHVRSWQWDACTYALVVYRPIRCV